MSSAIGRWPNPSMISRHSRQCDTFSLPVGSSSSFFRFCFSPLLSSPRSSEVQRKHEPASQKPHRFRITTTVDRLHGPMTASHLLLSPNTCHLFHLNGHDRPPHRGRCDPPGAWPSTRGPILHPAVSVGPGRPSTFEASTAVRSLPFPDGVLLEAKAIYIHRP